MGLFSKILGNELGADKAQKIEDAGAKILGSLLGEQAAVAEKRDAKQQSQGQVSEKEEVKSENNLSWGDQMPSEENSFSFAGTYQEYFMKVFTEEFPAYKITEEAAKIGKSSIFTFEKDGKTALIVEILSENSSAKKVRDDCKASGAPYLRFYYNHQGWWNTRSYVKDRTAKALGI